MHVGILPEVERGEIEAEHVDRAAQRAQAPRRKHAAADLVQRVRQQLQIGEQFVRAFIGRQVDQRLPRRDEMAELARRFGDARVNARDRAPIGLVPPRRRLVGGALGQHLDLFVARGEPRAERQFGAQLMQLVEIELQRPRALHPHRLGDDVAGDERIAVAVAADPGADAQERGDPPRQARGRSERIFDRAVELGQFAQERVVVIGEAVGDFVDHAKFCLAQHVGAPHRQDGAAQAHFVFRERRVVAGKPLALVQQRRNFDLARQRAFAPDFGRMRGQNRARQGVIEERADLCVVMPGLAGAAERIAEGTRPRLRARAHMGAVAADVVLVFRDIGEVREIAEGADDRQGLVAVEAVENRLKLAPRAGVVVPVEADRSLADALDDFVGLRAFLLAHGVAEQAAEEPHVLLQRQVLVVLRRGRVRVHCTCIHGCPRLFRGEA